MTVSKAYAKIRAKRIEKTLKLLEKPRTTTFLADKLDVSESTVRLLLTELQLEDKVHQVRRENVRCWLIGPPQKYERSDAVYLPKRPVHKTWPLNHVRDELVAFLFGMPEVNHG